MRIYNTLSRTKEEFVPLSPGEVRMYVCGVTPYDDSHIGHARSAVVFDVIRRYLAYRGFRVTMVRNYTDVDDKIIARAGREGVPAAEIAARYIAAEEQDMSALGVLPPDVAPRATAHVPDMIALIERLVAKGIAYAVDGDVYFEIRRFPPYGQFSGRNLDELLAGARVEVDERKRDPRDFALWKSAKPGEPSWPSPWGPGRPGWHIECSVMAMRYLGETFDIHGGGTDLIFPHHECEIAQAEADTGKRFARYWLHNGMLNLGAEKMSKSLGNTLTIRELVKRHDPDALRLWMLGTHYRNQLEWSEDLALGAGRTARGLRELLSHAHTLGGDEALTAFPRNPGEDVERFEARVFDLTPDAYKTKALVGDWLRRFRDAMDDDFNTPEALARIFSIRAELRRLRDDRSQDEVYVFLARLLLTLANVLGLFQRAVTPPDSMPREIEHRVRALLEQRDEARRRRDWARSDALRAELQALGVSVEDTPAGTRWTWKRG